MKTGVHALKGVIGCGKQTTGTDLSFTAVARDRFARFVDAEITESDQEEFDPTGGRSEPEEAFLGPFDARLTATIEGTVEGLSGYLIGGVLGSVATGAAVSGAYPHTYTLADTLSATARRTFELKYGTKAEAEVLNGVVKSYRYDFTSKGMVRKSFEALCGRPTYSSTPTSPTLPAANLTRLSQYMHTFTLFGITKRVRSGFWEIDHGSDEDDYDATSRERRDAEYGELMARFEVEMLFDDLTDLRRFWGSASATTPGDVPVYYNTVIKGEHPTVIGGAEKYTEQVTMPATKITNVSRPLRSRDLIIQRVAGRATYSPGSSAAVTVLQKNTQTTQ